MKTAKEFLHEKATLYNDGFLSGQVKWIVEAMEDYKNQTKMITGNEPAFIEHNTTIDDSHMQKGLTIRQHFAVMAMASDDFEASNPETYLIRAESHWLPKANALIKALNDEQ